MLTPCSAFDFVMFFPNFDSPRVFDALEPPVHFLPIISFRPWPPPCCCWLLSGGSCCYSSAAAATDWFRHCRVWWFFRCCSFFLLHSLCAIFFNILPNYYVIVTPFDRRPPHKTHKAGSAHVHSTPSTHVLHTCSSLHMYPRTYVLCPTHTPLRHSNLMQSFCAAVCCFYSYVAVFCFTLLLIRPLQYDSSLFPLDFSRTFLVLL